MSILNTAIDGQHVYLVTSRPSTGQVLKCPLAGPCSSPQILAMGVRSGWGISVDANAVYWVTEVGDVMKVAKH